MPYVYKSYNYFTIKFAYSIDNVSLWANLPYPDTTGQYYN